MTKRKPLEWYSTGTGYAPECDDCHRKLNEPHLRGACASVGIERGLSTDAMLQRYLEQYHANRHEEEQGG